MNALMAHSGIRRTVVDEYRSEVHATYRYLRLAIILLTLMLGCAVALQVFAGGGEVLPSVSAYYYTPARAVFVASLCAIAVCMIIHRGRSDLEDVLLNLSGYFAFFVAFVPTPLAAAASSAAVIVPTDVTAAVTNNTTALLVGGAVAFALEVFLVPRSERPIRSRSGRIALGLSAVVFVCFGLFFVLARDVFVQSGHGLAAVGLFVGIVGVVGVNGIAAARAARERGAGRRAQVWNRYTVGFTVMVVSTLAVVTVVRPVISAWVFVLETLLIAQFLVFWVVQTVERWRTPEVRQDDLVPG